MFHACLESLSSGDIPDDWKSANVNLDDWKSANVNPDDWKSVNVNPDDWKSANVNTDYWKSANAIFKKGSQYSPGSFRPVGLTVEL